MRRGTSRTQAAVAEQAGSLTTSEPRLRSVREVADLLRVSAKTVYDWTADRKLPSYKLGKRVLIDMADVERLLARARTF